MTQRKLYQFFDRLSVSIVLEQHPATSPWQDYVWQVVGLVAGTQPHKQVTCILQQGNIKRYLHPNFSLQLHRDECSSYYSNLQSENPACYIVLNTESVEPVPCLATLSFDEADVYLQEGREVQSVPLPPELYRWLEAYVLEHYVPQPVKKRKRKDWHIKVREKAYDT